MTQDERREAESSRRAREFFARPENSHLLDVQEEDEEILPDPDLGPMTPEEEAHVNEIHARLYAEHLRRRAASAKENGSDDGRGTRTR